MGSSDPLPAGFKIRLGSLNFQDTGNGYLMHITNRNELRARRQTGADRASVAPAAHAPASILVDVAGPLAPQRRRRSASARDRHERSIDALRTSPHSATRPPVRRQPLRRGSARFQGHVSPSVCAAPRQRTSPLPAPTRRCAGLVLSATFQRSGTPAHPLITAPPASCHPPPCTGTRSGTSPACLTQWSSDGSSTPRTTGSATPMTPEWGVTTPRGSASSCLPTTRQTPRMQQKLATEKFPPARELDRTRAWGQTLPLLTAEGG
jgi:hypothetical protein